VGEGGAGGPILEHRDDVIVHRAGEFGAALGEATNVVVGTLARLLLAVV
jgi:hypothetical protein